MVRADNAPFAVFVGCARHTGRSVGRGTFESCKPEASCRRNGWQAGGCDARLLLGWVGLGREPAVFVGAQQTVRSYRRCRINRVEHWRSRERWRRGPAASVIVEFVRRAVRTENSSDVFVACWRPTRAGRLSARMCIGWGIVLRGRAKTRRSSAVVIRPMRRR